MPNVPMFIRNRCTSVEQVDELTIRSTCRLQDTLTGAAVEILVKLPDLEIIAAQGEVSRTYRDECLDQSGPLQKMVGVRIGSGMLKIIKGLIGESTACSQLGFMVEECCHGVILAFTKDTLMQAPRDQELTADFYREMVKANTRLLNRCAAFAPGSSMVEGVEPPSK
ncbi:MAG: hypothetical protein V1816_15010 [Pseudomonadota bacterium]